MQRLHLFVSSPSDVRPERARVEVVAARLNGELEGLAAIEVGRWETGFYTAARSFQEAIDAAIGGMRGTDMVVCILWKRVGSELNPGLWRRRDGSPYESGTVFEVETAVEVSRQHRGVPDVYLFRKRAPVTYAAESVEIERAQHLLLEAVWRRWTETEAGHNVAGYQLSRTPTISRPSSSGVCGNGSNARASSPGRSGTGRSRVRPSAGSSRSRPPLSPSVRLAAIGLAHKLAWRD